jgi:DNA-binding LytR/AlgR family response regulator
MLKVMIVDDEKLALDELCYLLSNYADVEIIGMFLNPVEALDQIVLKKPDILFLDIDMPEISGLNLAKEVTGVLGNIEIVFVTAFDNYAINAFEVNAVDYILKPIQRDRLDRTIDRIRSRHKNNTKVGKSIVEKLNSIEKCIKQDVEKFAVWASDEIILLNASDIFYFTVENGSHVIITNRGEFQIKQGIDFWEERLKAYNFFRCHRSFLMNMDYIDMIIPYENNCCTIILKDNKYEIPVSRSKTKELRRKLDI